ncbi:DUF2341 domain-containing protein [Candidatus Omnitrophota bacterium]
MYKKKTTWIIAMTMIVGLCLLVPARLEAASLLSDNFDDSNFSSWTEHEGNWTETGGQATVDNTNACASRGDTGWTDYIVEADIYTDDDDYMGIAFRFGSTAYDCYIFYWYGGDTGTSGDERLGIGESTDSDMQIESTLVQTGATTIAQDAWHHMKVQVSGSNIKCYWNGELIFNITDSTHSSGKVGLWAISQSGGEWDNLSVTTIPVLSGSLPITDDFADADFSSYIEYCGEAWVESDGTVENTTNSDCLAARGSASLTDYVVQVRIYPDDDDYMGIAFRLTDDTHYYVWRWYGGDTGTSGDETLALCYSNDSDFAIDTILAQTSAGTYAQDAWHTMKVEVQGTSIKCYWDSSLKIDLTNSTHSAGAIGLWGYGEQGAEWDDLSVTAIPVLSGSLPITDDFADADFSSYIEYCGEAWVESDGTVENTTNSDCLAARGSASLTDYTVEVDIYPDDDDYMGIAFRLTDDTHYYVFRWYGGNTGTSGDETLALCSSDDSDFAIDTVIFETSAGTYYQDAWHTMKVEVQGTSIKCYWDSSLKIDLTNSTHSAGAIGLWGYGEQGAEWDNLSVTGFNTAPNAPTIDNYASGAWTSDSTPTLQFDMTDPDSGDIVKYQVQIDDTSNFSSTVVDFTETAGSPGYAVPRSNVTYTPSALSNGVSYYWRVKGIDDDSEESSWATANSGAIAFKVDTAAPTNVGCNTPANSATGISVTPTLTALTATDGSGSGLHSTAYYIELATDTGFSQNTQTIWDADGSWQPGTTLTPSTTYYWRVKARDAVSNESSLCGHTADTVGYGTFTTAAPTQVYYSVGTSTADLKTTADTLTMDIVSGVATFDESQANNIGVGDVITYSTTLKAYISGRTSSTVYSVITATGGTPGNVDDATVNTIKRVFNLLSDASDDADDTNHLDTADLAASNYQLNFPCYDDGAMNDSAMMFGDDPWVTGPNSYIRIYTPVSSSEVGVSQRHNGKSGTGFRMVPTHTSSDIYFRVLGVAAEYIRVEGLELDHSNVTNKGTTAGLHSSSVIADASDVRFEYNLIHGVTNSTNHDTAIRIASGIYNDSGSLKVANNIIYNITNESDYTSSQSRGISINEEGVNHWVYNNTVFDIKDNGTAGLAYGIRVSTGTSTYVTYVKNNYAGDVDSTNGGESCFARGTDDTEEDYNVSSDATAAGASSKTGKISYSDYFISVTSGGEDLYLKASSNDLWGGYGADLDSDSNFPITDDIEGQARDGSNPDIGADEYTYSAWWDSNWTYRKRLSFDNLEQTESLKSFPILVKLTSNNFNFSNAKTNGEDIRFIDSDNYTELAYEIEYWNAGSSTAFIWVRVPMIDGSSSSDHIYMYYDNTNADDNQSPAAVWSNGYAGVWHLDEGDSPGTTDFYKDSTVNANHGTLTDSSGGSAAATGQIDGAFDFEGDVDYIDGSWTEATGLATYSFWLNASAGSADWPTMLYTYPSSGNGKAWLYYYESSNVLGFQYTNTSDTTDTYVSNIDVSQGSLNYISYTHVAASGAVEIFKNGSSAETDTLTATGDVSFTGYRIGYVNTSDHPLNGIIDEFRISDVIRSADWIAAQYKAMSCTFTTFGAEITEGEREIIVRDSTITVDAEDARWVWDESSGRAGGGISQYYDKDISATDNRILSNDSEVVYRKWHASFAQDNDGANEDGEFEHGYTGDLTILESTPTRTAILQSTTMDSCEDDTIILERDYFVYPDNSRITMQQRLDYTTGASAGATNGPRQIFSVDTNNYDGQAQAYTSNLIEGRFTDSGNSGADMVYGFYESYFGTVDQTFVTTGTYNIRALFSVDAEAIPAGEHINNYSIWYQITNAASSQSNYINDFRNPDALDFSAGSAVSGDERWDEVETSGGLSFDGADDYVRADDTAALSPTTAVTVEAWFFVDATPGDAGKSTPHFGMVQKDGGISGFGNYGFRLMSDFRVMAMLSHGSGSGENASSNSNGKIIKNKWQHVAMTYDKNVPEWNIYINGTLDESKNTYSETLLDSGDPFLISNGDGRYFSGKIDEVRVWNVARTQTQIRENMYKELTGSESNLVAYYKLNEGSGQTVTDSAGSSDGHLGVTTGSEASDPSWHIGYAGDGYNEAEGCYTVTCGGTYTTGTPQAAFDLDGSSNQRYNPVFKFRHYTSFTDPVYRIETASVKTNDTDYVADLIPFTDAYFMNDTAGDPVMTDLGQAGNPDSESEYFASTSKDYTLDLDEAATTPNNGTPDGDAIYFGSHQKFSGVNIDLDTNGVGGNGEWQYWDGDSWTDMSVSETVTDAKKFFADGAVYWADTDVLGWQKTAVGAGDETGLVGYWDFNEDTSGSADGDTIYDRSSNSNNGTGVDGANNTGLAWAAGRAGNAIEFDGVDDYVSMGDNVDIASALTVEVWVKTDSVSGDHIIDKDNEYALYFSGTTLRWKIGTTDPTNAVYSSWTDGKWYHLVGIWDGTNASLYIDGALIGTDTKSATATTNALFIGTNSPTPGSYFDGLIDEVRIYNVARSPAQIKTDYERGRQYYQTRFVTTTAYTTNPVENQIKTDLMVVQDLTNTFDTATSDTVLINKTPNDAPSAPTIDNYNDGSWGKDNTPTLQFDLSDPDAGDIIKYQIQIDTAATFDSQSGSPLVDVTEGTGSASPRSNVQYTPSTLNDGSYYWRVKGIDDEPAEGNWATANSGAIAFKIDTVLPTVTGVACYADSLSDGASYDDDATVGLQWTEYDALSGIALVNACIGTTPPDESVSVAAESDTDTGSAGSNTYYVQVIDNAGNPSTVGSDTITIDLTNPTAPGNLTFASKTANSVTLTYGAQSTETYFDTYKIYYKQAQSGVTTSDTLHTAEPDATNLDEQDYNSATTATISSLTTNQYYTFNIWAYDFAGRSAAAAQEITVFVGECTLISSSIDYDDGVDAISWGEISWNDTETSGDVNYQVQFWDGDSWELIPDGALSSNSSGFDTSPINIAGLNTTTYNQIRLKATFTYGATATPVMSDWTVAWILDTTDPVPSEVEFQEVDINGDPSDSSSVYIIENDGADTYTIYYSGDGTSYVKAYYNTQPTDADSGVKEVAFPYVFGIADSDDTSSPYSMQYTIDSSDTNTGGPWATTVYDNVNRSAVSTNALYIVKEVVPNLTREQLKTVSGGADISHTDWTTEWQADNDPYVAWASTSPIVDYYTIEVTGQTSISPINKGTTANHQFTDNQLNTGVNYITIKVYTEVGKTASKTITFRVLGGSPPDVDLTYQGSAPSTGVWYQGTGEQFSFTSVHLDNNEVGYYKYVIDTSSDDSNATTDPSSGTQWSSGTLNADIPSSKYIYIHYKPYPDSGEDVGATTHEGPFQYVETGRLLRGGKFFDDDGTFIEHGPKSQ